MKQRQLAEELGVSPSYLSQVRHGKRPISAEVLGVASSKKLSKLLSSEPRNHSVGKGGLEPPRLSAHDPKSCSSANSDTPPIGNHLIQ